MTAATGSEDVEVQPDTTAGEEAAATAGEEGAAEEGATTGSTKKNKVGAVLLALAVIFFLSFRNRGRSGGGSTRLIGSSSSSSFPSSYDVNDCFIVSSDSSHEQWSCPDFCGNGKYWGWMFVSSPCCGTVCFSPCQNNGQAIQCPHPNTEDGLNPQFVCPRVC